MQNWFVPHPQGGLLAYNPAVLLIPYLVTGGVPHCGHRFAGITIVVWIAKQNPCSPKTTYYWNNH